MTSKGGRHPLRVGEMGEIWATQLEPGRWRAGARYGAPEGGTKQIVRIAKTAAAARRKVEAAINEATRLTAPGIGDDEELTDESTTRELLEAALTWHVREPKVRPQTTRTYVTPANRVALLIGDGQIKDLSLKILQDTVDHIATKPPPKNPGGRKLKPSYSQARLARHFLRYALRTAAARGIIPLNPASDLKVPVRPQAQGDEVEVDDFTRKELTGDQVGRLLSALAAYRTKNGPGTPADQQARRTVAIAILQLQTGARIGEILALRVGDVVKHQDGWGIHIRGTIVEGDGPTRRAPTTKSGENRCIALPARAQKVVQSLLEGRDTTDERAPLIQTHAGTYVAPSSIRRTWRKALEKHAPTLRASHRTDSGQRLRCWPRRSTDWRPRPTSWGTATPRSLKPTTHSSNATV